MRSHIPLLDTNAMPWTTNPDHPGLFTKMLSFDEETKARTALQRIDVTRGYQPPTKPHFHDIDEELLILHGRLTFDGENWLGRNAYCYHPARTVHGFKSAVDEEAWFLSRVTAPLAFTFVDEPAATDRPYSLDGTEEVRPIRVLADPGAERWQEHDRDGNRARTLVLSANPATGEGSTLVEYLPGYRETAHAHQHETYQEVFVTAGEIVFDDGTVAGSGGYSYRPPGARWPGFSSPKGATVYVNHGGTPQDGCVPSGGVA